MHSPIPARSSIFATCPTFRPERPVSSEASAQTSAAAPAAGSGGGDLQRRYTEELTVGHFTSDADQRAIVGRLDALRQRLLEPASGFALPRWLAALTGRDLTPVQGLYLWGGVG